MKQQLLEKQVKELEEQNAHLAGRLLVARELASYLGVYIREVTPEDVFKQLMADAEAHTLAKFAHLLVEEHRDDLGAAA